MLYRLLPDDASKGSASVMLARKRCSSLPSRVCGSPVAAARHKIKIDARRPDTPLRGRHGVSRGAHMHSMHRQHPHGCPITVLLGAFSMYQATGNKCTGYLLVKATEDFKHCSFIDWALKNKTP